jgi:hypothetical protein
MAETTQKVTPETPENAENANEAGDAAQTTDAAATTEGAKKEKGRVDFPIADVLTRDKEGNVVSAVNADGKLTAVPKPIKDGDGGKVLYAGYNTRKHNPLKKTDFADLQTYLRHQAFVARVKAAILVKSAVDKEAKADRIEQFGDEETRKKVAKMARMKDQLAELTKQLEDDGIDTSNI